MMREMDEIIALLAQAQHKAEALHDDNLASRIGTALLLAIERQLQKSPPKQH